MKQFMTTEAMNDPWCNLPTAIQNNLAEMEFEEQSRSNHWGSCLCCCKGSKQVYARARLRAQEERDEESTCLVECDELDLTWQRTNTIPEEIT